MSKVNFIRKALIEELVPRDHYKINKVIKLKDNEFREFSDSFLEDYEFIAKNKELMFIDDAGVFNAILVTTDSIDYGILVLSEGYNYARYTAYVNKSDLEDKI